MEILRVNHLTKIYGEKSTEVIALDDVSFSVDKGEFVAIVGPSGSGKSTLLHILGCVDYPSSGQVVIDQVNINDLNEKQLAIFRRRQISIIYQFYNLIPVLNVIENITLPLELDNRSPDEREVNKILELIDLEDRKHFFPGQLSGGQQQRVSIGRALMNQPTVLLADEPTGNLDSKNSERVLKLLMESNQKNKQTILLITHNMDIALKANRIIHLQDGKIVRDDRVR